ncbi:microcompartment protein PduM [Escherichia coli]|uniref:Microcompartment protein PduM n=1 Tax=Escherichia coli TaxID=562 RepID=A0AAP7TW40_ECOLX|nr:microcompartment protein PduM [Escherichia coli]EEZ0359766.1 microcompartment protein PduM [Escherichia coli]EFL1981392.1 microcompartment protein PduM [Escherichia coli]EHC4142085.1 microcompartment protein PduM [Escherichia coli]EHE2559208.1 microcompartment protein PduM [Escherichia coli]EIH4170067.1 microcompartment protein PduM [Escherichia coli]
MNAELSQHIVEKVVLRLQQRAVSTRTLSPTQLQRADLQALFCHYSTLYVTPVDLQFLQQIIENGSAAESIHTALAWGIHVRLSLRRSLLPAIPVKQLARLPLELSDEHGQRIFLHSSRLLSYVHVAPLSEGVLVLRSKCVVTALAREAADARNIQLLKQE